MNTFKDDMNSGPSEEAVFKLLTITKKILEKCSSQFIEPYSKDAYLKGYFEDFEEHYHQMMNHFDEVSIEMKAIAKYSDLICCQERVRRSWLVSLYLQLVNFTYDIAIINEKAVHQLLAMMPEPEENQAKDVSNEPD